MIKARCTECGNLHYSNDCDSSNFVNCPDCGTAFSHTSTEKWEKIRTPDDSSDAPGVSQIIFVGAILIGVLGVVASYYLGGLLIWYGQDYNWIVLIIGLILTLVAVLPLLVLKAILDMMNYTKIEVKRIREFMEYQISMGIKKQQDMNGNKEGREKCNG